MPGGKLPDGCQFHVAGPVEGGFRVITVWDSEDAFQQFRNDTLMPAMKEADEEGRIAPNITADPVHNIITP
jgi:heme-degrading monooxygenase HmoA